MKKHFLEETLIPHNQVLWQNFLHESRNRTMIVLGYTVFLVILAMLFEQIWLILIGEALLWGLSYIWQTWKKKSEPSSYE